MLLPPGCVTPPVIKPAVTDPNPPALMNLPVLISAISVQEVPLYCSTEFPAGAGSLDPATIPESAPVPNPVAPYLPVFKAPPDAHVAPAISNIVSLKVFVVELKNNLKPLCFYRD